MFGFKSRNDVLIVALLEKLVDQNDKILRQMRTLNTNQGVIMASQADFNAKVSELDLILDVVSAGMNAQKQVIANLEAEVARLRENDVDTSALDAVLQEARDVQASIAPALDPTVPTPQPSEVPVVTPVDGAETVDPIDPPRVDDVVADGDSSGENGGTVTTPDGTPVEEAAADAAVEAENDPNSPEGTADTAAGVDSAIPPADADAANEEADGTLVRPAEEGQNLREDGVAESNTDLGTDDTAAGTDNSNS